MHQLTTCLLLISLAWANATMALEPYEEVDADASSTRFLVYAVTWQPTSCKTVPMKAGCDQPPQRFLTHGLWPYSESVGDRTNRHPQYCTQSPACDDGSACAMSDGDREAVLSNAHLRALAPGHPAEMLAHQWEKHGTCSGKTMQQYFQDFVDLRRVVIFKDESAFERMIGQATAFSEIRKVFPANTAFRCHQDAHGEQYLHEVFYLIDHKGEPYLDESHLQTGSQCAERTTWIPRGKV
nr:hypothetical protein [uncultured Pseudomonas sp.]